VADNSASSKTSPTPISSARSSLTSNSRHLHANRPPAQTRFRLTPISSSNAESPSSAHFHAPLISSLPVSPDALCVFNPLTCQICTRPGPVPGFAPFTHKQSRQAILPIPTENTRYPP
jgi:hypothetical protein